MQKLKWGVISAGRIASVFSRQLPGSNTGSLYAVASRSVERAREFAEKYGAEKFYGSYDELIADPQIDAVYVATPHPMHAEWAVKACRAGKHVLCEKPLTMNRAEARDVIDVARESGVFFMEAFHYRCHPQMRAILDAVRSGVIGKLRMIRASFSFNIEYDPAHRALSKELGGGGILDVGCYAASFARVAAGAASGSDFSDPETLCGAGRIGETGVDEYAACCAKFPGEIVAELSCGVQLRRENDACVYGDKGWIHVPQPWVVAIDGGVSRFFIHKDGDPEPEEIVVHADRGLFAIEADTVGESVARGLKEPPPPAMGWDDTLGNMKTLDMWREALGLRYDHEKR